MNFLLTTSLLAALVFVGIMAMVAVGRWIGQRRTAAEPSGSRPGLGSIEAAVYGLLGLLIAFSFTGAAERFAARRALVLQEANAIGTAYLRVDLLPEARRAAMRDRFRRYLDARLEAYEAVPDMTAARAALDRSLVLQGEIWKEAQGESSWTLLLLPALNAMFDIATTRLAATATHPPSVLSALLIALALVSALLSGHAMSAARGRNWLHTVAYAAVLSVAIYVILDLEYPRLGLIRVDAADQMLRDVRASMK